MAQDYQKAVFNEGVLIARRLDAIQSRINSVRVNPLAFNSEQNTYNYNVWFGDLCSLLNEAWSKLTEDEQNEINKFRKIIEECFLSFPIHKTIINENLNTRDVKVKYSHWYKIKPLLDIFEREIKVYLDRHGLANPDIEGGDMF